MKRQRGAPLLDTHTQNHGSYIRPGVMNPGSIPIPRPITSPLNNIAAPRELTRLMSNNKADRAVHEAKGFAHLPPRLGCDSAHRPTPMHASSQASSVAKVATRTHKENQAHTIMLVRCRKDSERGLCAKLSTNQRTRSKPNKYTAWRNFRVEAALGATSWQPGSAPNIFAAVDNSAIDHVDFPAGPQSQGLCWLMQLGIPSNTQALIDVCTRSHMH